MSNKKIAAVYLFLFLLPYLCALLVIGTSYNALVLHSASLWRTIIGAAVGAVVMSALKVTVERPLAILVVNATRPSLRSLLDFFNVDSNVTKRILNLSMDFVLCGIATWAVRNFFPKEWIMWSLIGWLMLIMFLSVLVGGYIDYDLLSVERTGTKEVKAPMTKTK
ncbi:hypothetical protein [Schleiferilactobacillus perolens]|jgi:hypothetical protein|uniref:hypothetical protein n=1 Tax=Schleiferilactobacillus perolens TaxID=100468 RepID=UPI0023576AAC|nr:hypothetical protein [Schleiferilactobacillus perolens]MCI1892463.1 hypothetical protein [Schleiferilactobacillus harbinensis]MCI1911594.1 hypothetical protein [Schleiferilactobacillus harbinensis]MCI2170302.1 hypothetical protein [Schleiferilactobacillus perolens]